MSGIRLRLSSQDWQFSNRHQAHVRGTAFAGNEKLSGTTLAASLPSAEDSFDGWQESLTALNGFFALAQQSDNATVVAVDRVRSIPLFYGEQGGTVFVSDDADWVRTQLGNETMEPVVREEFQLAGYVTGPDTLFPDLKQLQAGELLYIRHGDKPEVSTHRWYRFTHDEPDDRDEAERREQLDQSAEASVRRLAEYANGRQIVIPLSGGYDCRIIALLLKRIGYQNILTFTYGVPGNKESEYSRRVAEALDLPWHFVEYNAQKWKAAWNTDERLRYQRQGSGWTSLPHVQDWLAVREMAAEGVVNDDAVFCPGHSGDFVAGSHIPASAKLGGPADAAGLTTAILHKHLSLAPLTRVTNRSLGFWKNRILGRAEAGTINAGEDLADAFEKWDWQERQAKFIINSVRVYEFYGYDWWLPLWDAEFMAFWQGVPLPLRKGSTWYTNYVRQVYQEAVGEPDLGHSATTIRKRLAQTVPVSLRRLIKKVYPGRPGAWKAQSSLDRYPSDRTKAFLRLGFGHNGVVAQFFLEGFRSES